MTAIRKIAVSTGIYWVEIADADVRLLCGCPVDAVKHLVKKGFIAGVERDGIEFETGPNAILLSDLTIQSGRVCNYAEFPVLQMLYMQGLIVPGHPNNRGVLPMLIGSRRQVDAQMAYIFRGNYGLESEAELLEAGASPALALELMRMKRAFAFGRIRPTEELLDPVYLESDAKAIGGGVSVSRSGLNLFRVDYQGEHVDIDLTLAPGQSYECSYRLESHLLRRDYFSVVHSGDGDGWDINRPAMSSIVLYQGRVYLIDAGPNIQASLDALGIGVNEIEGVFQTHCHDDHFAGLTQLMCCDRRIPYFAVPMVRATVAKKLAAMLGGAELEFRDFFEVRDLLLDEWNEIDGLEVKPILSPHPVETTCFQFRVFWENGYRTYAHLADIASLEVLQGMLSADAAPEGISAERLAKTQRDYAEPANVKKIDIGGGLIHGAAADFHGDASDRLVLAHTHRLLTEQERAIGSGAPFGTVDVLIEGVTDQRRRNAFDYLRAYFPTVHMHWIRHLMNNEIVTVNPEALLIKEGQAASDAFLILSGSAEMLSAKANRGYVLFGGSMLGEMSALLGTSAEDAYRAISFVQALRVPRDIYRDFVIRNSLYRDILLSRQESDFLRSSSLFAEGVSGLTLNRLLQAAQVRAFEAGSECEPPETMLLLIHSGSALLEKPDGSAELLAAGSHVGLGPLGGTAHRGSRIRFRERTETYALPLELVGSLPIVRWKLIETYRRRYLDVY
jgi:hemerythrin